MLTRLLTFLCLACAQASPLRAAVDPSVMISNVSFEYVPLREAVAQLLALAKADNPGKQIPSCTFTTTKCDHRKVTDLKLRNVPLDVALKYVSDFTSTEIVLVGDAFVVSVAHLGGNKPKQ